MQNEINLEGKFIKEKADIFTNDQGNEIKYFQIFIQKDMAEIKLKISKELYEKTMDKKLEYGDKVEVTYPVSIVNSELQLGRVVKIDKIK